MKTYNVGIVGFGFMGKAHTYAYKAIPFFYGRLPIDVKLKAVCTLPKEAAQKAAEDFGFETWTTDVKEFFENDLDIVHVCSPNDTHKEVILEALKRNIHVYCEKPLTDKYEDAMEILEALKGKNVVNRIGFHSRFYPCAIRAKEIIDSGRIGNPIGFHIRYYTMNRLEGTASPNALATGAIIDLGCHLTDMARYLMGDFDSLFADVKYLNENTQKSAEDAFFAIVKMKNGAEGVIEASKIAYGANNEYIVEIYCEKGALKFDIENLDWLLFYDANDRPGPYGGDRGYKKIECFNRYPERCFPSPRHSPGWLGGHLHSIYSFLKAIGENQTAAPSLEDGAYIQNVLDKLAKSAKEKRWITV
ncbi:MAG: Gfo/Idh/MocA family protein [Thermovenabulum sp.]|uniref:Gfo/Idh/MocA family protein n=1 Tax=Thermovenabulum sp. TaxID=3100335 RepID=UPI003C7CC18A